jgi:hypothetical protein
MPHVTPDDDQLHEPASPDLYWTETHWFAFAVPERKLTGCVYPVIRTNQRIASCSVQVWDDSAEEIYYAPYGRVYWHLPMPDDLRNWDLPNGLSFRCIEPLRRWELTFSEGDDFAFELAYEGLHEPYVPHRWGQEDATSHVRHFDQLCRVTGTLTLNGEDIPVDCIEMRDKSWSPRSDGPRTGGADRSGGAYSYGSTGPDDGFCVYAMGGDTTAGPHDVVMGYLWRDGQLGRLTSGRRRRERDARGRPSHVVVEGTDEHGRSFTAEGSCVNNFVHLSTPNGFAWMSGTPWVIDGTQGWGEDQEVWDAASLRRAVRDGDIRP